ncbi:hypothetical protein O6H91_06G060700 [Diphasiastrum complanatum]|uniref:Uncharacterized protein n=2 Tax=Diphasiastrum complanatum TaxID=34168 RepID=A0ACC2DE88_DIPCM|nr:hypothetical protein O6H91_Y476300 [Diphasiastrum complanatum]KAJ7552581.1 hypothetical protein O6H91_06G060700 [Diphasiastrum complanatum]KAJ7552582.1 hypothetical protein O6H91_06G060700 [Diphasiastrum complanatum]
MVCKNMTIIEINLGLSLVSNTKFQQETEAENDQLHSPAEMDPSPSLPIAQLTTVEQSSSFSLLTLPRRLLSGASFADGSDNFEKVASSSRSSPQSPIASHLNLCSPANKMGLSTLSLQENRIGQGNLAKTARGRENNIPSRIKILEGTSNEVENRSLPQKLRLSKKQWTILEESFQKHNTINRKRKNALAEQLKLKARQVEVWFQNRRARARFKQTEVDCEVLRSRCESLREENRRLQQEIQELRALNLQKRQLIHG